MYVATETEERSPLLLFCHGNLDYLIRNLEHSVFLYFTEGLLESLYGVGGET